MPKAKAKTADEALALFEDGELPPMPGKVETQAFEVYNEVAEKAGWTRANKLSPDRQAKLRKAVHEVGGLVEWRAALELGARSTFLTTKFKPDIEFVCRKPKIVKMSEGGYSDPGTAADGKPSLGKMMAPSDPWAVWLRDYKPRGFWPAHLGPRPEEPNCRAPAPMVAAWRERVGFKAPAVVRETAEDRLAHLVVSYRQRGFYDKGNIAEEELARLQGRPAVLVPGPDVAGLTGAGSDRRAAPPASRIKPAFVDVSPEPPFYDDIPEGDDYGVEGPE